MSRLYIIRGAPGSGKTTLAQKFHEMGLVGSVFEADMFMTNSEGDYHFDPRRLKDCHKKCQDAVRLTLSRGESVAVSNTFTRLWEMEPYLGMNYPTTVIRCEGAFGNIHGVPPEKVAEMRRRFEDYPSHKKEGQGDG